MGPGFKYHVVTIAAIFFALTVGLVVGSLFVSPIAAVQQTRAINAMRTTIVRDNDEKKRQIRHYEEFLAGIMPTLLRGRLTNANVAIVQTGDYPEATESVRATMQMADARVLSVTTLDHLCSSPDERLKPILAALQSSDPRLPADRDGLIHTLVTALARGDTSDDSLIAALERGGLLHTESGNDYKTPVQYVVIVAGSSTDATSRPLTLDKPLIAEMQKQNLTVAACEPLEAARSDIGDYRANEIDVATVDNVDADMGRCALVFALRGDKDDYGVKVTARRLLPVSLARTAGAAGP